MMTDPMDDPMSSIPMSMPVQPKPHLNVGMSGLRNIFGDACSGNDANTYQYGVASLATNLTETNIGIAQQSPLLDELIDLNKQQQRQQHRKLHHYLFSSNQSNVNSNNNNNININNIINQSIETEPGDNLSDLTSRLNKLSVTDRLEAQNDIYGFRSRYQNEDPVQLSTWMNEMDDLIDKGISGNDKIFSALRFAMHMDGDSGDGLEYVRSQRLKFLRAADWSAALGVHRMALYFGLKLEHFGSESLVRDLTLVDLRPTDREVWRQKGFLQLSPERDASGRAILIILVKQQTYLPVDIVVRCVLYMSEILSRDDSIQLAGNTQLIWANGQNGPNGNRSIFIHQALRAIPLRGVSRHICYDHEAMRAFILLVAVLSPLWATLRLLTHRGTVMECLYNLMTCGIPRNAIPINSYGEIELDFHHRFLDSIEKKEAGDRKQRLDKQIRQLLLQNQVPTTINNNNSNITTTATTAAAATATTTIDGFRNGPKIPDGRGEPYQREPPEISFHEDMQGLNPLSMFRSEESEVHPDAVGMDFSQVGVGNNAILEPRRIPMTSPASAIIKRRQVFHNSQNASTSAISDGSGCNTETQRDESSDIVPGELDVILGRGRYNKFKPGNQKLNQMIENCVDRYEASDKFRKTVLSEVVVSKMLEGGSRFLIRETGDKKHNSNQAVWVEVPLEKARDKVAHDFRNLRLFAKRNAGVPRAASATNEIGAPKRPRSRGDVNAAEEQNEKSKSRNRSNASWM